LMPVSLKTSISVQLIPDVDNSPTFVQLTPDVDNSPIFAQLPE